MVPNCGTIRKIEDSYTYDAWGNCSVVVNENNVANINPFRYRGYYFDTESGLYYLMSRYYDPEIGQFISMDTPDYLYPELINGIDLYSYCGNEPINRYDPTGHFWDYLLDGVFIILGLNDLIKDPSWAKAGWLALDIALALLPVIPALSSARHLNKVDDVIDLTKTYGHIDNFADAGGVIRKANKADFVDDGWDLVQGLNKTDDGFTISHHVIVTNIHTKFMNGGKVINKLNKVDGIDEVLGIVYELKPYNRRNIRKGIKQLYRYRDALVAEGFGLYKKVLVLY